MESDSTAAERIELPGGYYLDTRKGFTTLGNDCIDANGYFKNSTEVLNFAAAMHGVPSHIDEAVLRQALEDIPKFR